MHFVRIHCRRRTSFNVLLFLENFNPRWKLCSNLQVNESTICSIDAPLRTAILQGRCPQTLLSSSPSPMPILTKTISNHGCDSQMANLNPLLHQSWLHDYQWANNTDRPTQEATRNITLNGIISHSNHTCSLENDCCKIDHRSCSHITTLLLVLPSGNSGLNDALA